MSHAAVFRICQMPCRLGVPSGVRGGADTCAVAGVAASERSPAISAIVNPCRIGKARLARRNELVARRTWNWPRREIRGDVDDVFRCEFLDDRPHQRDIRVRSVARPLLDVEDLTREIARGPPCNGWHIGRDTQQVLAMTWRGPAGCPPCNGRHIG